MFTRIGRAAACVGRMDGRTIHRYNARTHPHKHPQLVTHSRGAEGCLGVEGGIRGGRRGSREDRGEGVQVSRISEPPEAPRGLSASFKGQPLQ